MLTGNFYSRRIILAAACAAGLTLSALHASTAMAQESAPQQIVAFADLDIATAEGATALYERLRSAARTVCSDLQGRTAAEVRRYADCRNKALDQAVRTVGARTLTALHAKSAPVTAQASATNAAG